MRHYPTTEELSALLEAALADEHRVVCARLIDAEARYSQLRTAGRSLAHAVGEALRLGDITNTSARPCANALRQWVDLTQGEPTT